MEGSVRRLAAVLIAGILAVNAFAGGLERAFAALEVHNYFEAMKLFGKQVRKHPAAAWYGISVVTGRADNPFYQIDSSRAALLRSEAAYALLDAKGRSKMAALGVDTATIRAQKEHIGEIVWKQVVAVDRIGDYKDFILAYPGNSHLQEAIERRNALAFADARRLNTAAAYKDFITNYPDAKEAYGARSRLQESIYRDATQAGTLAQYEAFIHDHPESPYARDAQDKLMELSVPHGTVGEYAAFIHRYPNNPNVPDAWRHMYDLYTRQLSVQSITQFLKDYPDYPFINELMNDYKVAGLTLVPFRQDGKWGYIDATGVERIKAEYEFAEPFVHSQAQVGKGGHSGTINKLGKEVVPIIYDDVFDFKEGLAPVELNGKQGVVDRNGNLVVAMEYDEVGEFDHGLAAASKDGKYGFIDGTGKVVIPFRYENAMHFNNGLAVVVQGGLSGVVDVKGDVAVPCQYDWVEGFLDPGITRVRKDGYMGMINRFGEAVLAVEHDHVGPINDSLALVIDKGKCGYVDANGAWVIPQRFEANALTVNMGDFHNGVARVLSGGKLGLVDTKGKWIFPAQYVDIGQMEGNVVPVKKKNKWGYASRAYQTLAEAKYDQAWEMHSGYGRVASNGLFGLVDSTGAETIKPRFKALSDVDGGALVATDDSGTGLVDVHGKVLVPLVFSSLVLEDHGLAKVTKGDRFGYVEVANDEFLWKEEGFGTGLAHQ